MEHNERSEKIVRKHKILVMFPLLVLPFITLLFWALGGGKVNPAHGQQVQKGLNMQLPGANIKEDKPFDKLSYYEKAAADSLKMQQLIEKDPYYLHGADTFPVRGLDNPLLGMKYNSNKGIDSRTIGSYGRSYADPNEAKVNRKLAELNAALNKASAPDENHSKSLEKIGQEGSSIDDGDMDRLKQMMQIGSETEGEDPEIQQLNGMLEKVLDIQHPDRIRERVKQTSAASKGQVFPVVAEKESNPISLLENKGTRNQKDTRLNLSSHINSFYSLDDTAVAFDNHNAIEAVIHETQTLVNGSTVKLRLVNDVFINGTLIPKDNFVFGTATLAGERLSIKINSIRYRKSLFPVELSAYDIDGMDGIYVPGSITNDVAKLSADQAAQQISVGSLNPSFGAQAASAGIEAARSIFSRKVKLVKVKVKSGYQVFLKNEK